MAKRPPVRVLEHSNSIDQESYEPAYAYLAGILRHSMATGCASV